MTVASKALVQNDQNPPRMPPAPDVRKKLFADRLHELMRKRDWNQSELGRRTNLTRGTINNYLREQALPSPLNLEKIAKALRTTPEHLLPDNSNAGGHSATSVVEYKLVPGDSSLATLTVMCTVSADLAARIVQAITNDLSAFDAE